MKTKPVKRYRAPGYPAKLQVQSCPALLHQNMPPTWRAVPPLAGAAALFLSLNAFPCRGADKGTGSSGAVAIVAPIFDHGDGRGSTGCIVVSPPAFLSEEEAWQVIREELDRNGVELTEKKRVIQGVTTPLTQQVEDAEGEISLRLCEPGSGAGLFKSQASENTPFAVDAFDPKKHIAVEFVSAEDFTRMCGHDWLKPDGNFCMSTVRGYRVKDHAGLVAESMKKGGREKLYFGTFYDPLTQFEFGKNWRESQSSSRAESQRLLRLQVQDFVKWLQGQGVI